MTRIKDVFNLRKNIQLPLSNSFHITAINKQISALLFVIILSYSTINAQSNATLSRFVSASSDDVEEVVAGGTGTIGTIDLTSPDLENMVDGNQYQIIGSRFKNITLPRGAIITNAYIQFTTRGNKNAVLGDIVFKGEAIDSSITFATTAFNVSSRTVTTDSVVWPGSTSSSWGFLAGGTRGVDQKTPNLKTIVQNIVNRTGWKSGNAITFIWRGTGVRNAYTYDGFSIFAPELVIQYQVFPALLIPNGGETWQAGAQKNITYNANGIQTLKLEYSNNGITWNTITNNASGSAGSYIWTLPNNANTPAATYKIRISDSSNTVFYDTSASYFTIASDTLIKPGTSWKYKDDGSNQNTAWRDSAFNDGTWNSGNTELGYGDGDEATLVNACGVVTLNPTCTNKYITTYFRKKVYIPNLNDFNNFSLQVVRDDGAIVYVNGNEVWRNNLPSGTIAYNTLASTDITGSDESAYQLYTLAKTYFVNGWNTIAVEIHQQSGSSPDVSFNLRLKGNQAPLKPINVLAPNGGETLSAGNTYAIKWFNNTSITKIKIEYSTNGSIWSTIASNVLSSLGTINWLIPNTPSSQCMLRISDSANVAVFDTTNARFTIAPPATLIKGPYLQVVTQNAATIRWRTDYPTPSRIRLGTTRGILNLVKDDSTFVTEHEVRITGLNTYTKYFYSLGSLNDTLQGDSNNYFRTLAAKGDNSKLYRIGVIGDCGNASTNQINVRNQFVSYLGNNYLDSWLLLGDNAYGSGTDIEYQAHFFNIYKNDLLKKYPLWPAPGNHDYENNGLRQNDHDIPYYDLFTMPTASEAGGVASGTEAFYSYDIGNIHFLSLDSYGRENNATRLYDTLGAQVTWIKNDLAANTNKQWIVAYWHHPPYTMGSHNSDTETPIVLIRQNFIKILERYGVDLILTGHSHDYERSKLMKGHYGYEASFDSLTHNISQSTGKYNGSSNSCPYIKDTLVNAGTVYVVSGSAGQLGGTQGSQFPHSALPFSNAIYGGAMMLEVQNNRLDAKWICSDGVIRDQFTMVKNVNQKTTINANLGDSVTLTASFVGNYTWNNTSQTSRTIKVLPPNGTTVYYVTDTYSCLRDSFTVNTTTLPITLLNFDAQLANKKVKLNWSTAMEINNNFFTVERSENGKTFYPIANIKGAGNSNKTLQYSLIDDINTVNANTIFYRLKQTDFDGRFTYSKTATIDLGNVGNFDLSVFPNPNSGTFTIGLSNVMSETIYITIFDLLGNEHFVQEIETINGKKNIELSLPPGFYTLNATTIEGKVIVQKIFVNK
ncbi:MAG: metallophosphoesterase [Bacteroidota bacterium]